jgi:cytochrome c oxidase subunit 2
VLLESSTTSGTFYVIGGPLKGGTVLLPPSLLAACQSNDSTAPLNVTAPPWSAPSAVLTCPSALNALLEVAWTLIPVLILVIIAIPSFRLIYYEDRTVNPDLTVKVMAHQWYWEYSYPDNGNIDIESRYIADEDLKPGQLRLLDVDNQLVVPVGKRIRILTNSSDVIHSFFIPALGVQRYAIPGRTIETWMQVDKEGVFYGECNQICGANHSRMPIAIHAVSVEAFNKWVADQKKQASGAPLPKVALN